jgi:YD repeat-containing protein
VRRPLQSGLLALALALTGAATAAAAAPEASFSVDPAAPVAGEEVRFADTSTGFSPTLPLQRDWDLDGDGAYDDATGATAARAFPAGEHQVALRVRQSGIAVIERVARRTIGVAPPGEPTPDPTPVPTPEPVPTPAPAGNEPPKPALDLGCRKVGGTILFCPGLIARKGVAKQFDAGASSDPDGKIVRYEWDLDGNGSFERDTGADPTTAYTYVELLFRGGSVKVRLRVTDDKGASATRTYDIRLLPPGCQEDVTIGALAAHSACFRRHNTLGLVSYVSEPDLPVSVNGISIVPHVGKRVEILVRDGKVRRVQGEGVVTVPARGVTAKLVDGAFSWGAAGDRLTGFAPDARAELNGLRITGVPQQPRLVGPGSADVWFHVALPKSLGGASSDAPILARTGAAGASGAGDALEFEVSNASLGIIELKQLRVAYDGEDLWEISAAVLLPPPIPYTVSAEAGIRDGDFHHAGAGIDFGTPGIGPLGPVFIQRISFRVEVNPKQSECVPHIGVVHSDDLPAQQALEEAIGVDIPDVTYDYGKPDFALCGEIGLTGGPSILGAAALRLDAGLGFVTFPDRPAELRAHGQLYVVEIPLAKANFMLATDGYVRASARFHFGWDDVAHIEGFLAYEMLAPKFNAHGRVKACADFVDWCASADALISSRGVAVCLRIDLGLADWSPGFGYLWGDPFPDLYFTGCDVGEYREHINRKVSAAGATARSAGFEQAVDLPAGLPGAVIAVEGRDAPPQVTLVGPDGERVTAPRGLEPLERKPYLVLKDPRRNVTQFAVGSPARGRWKVVVEEGSSPVVSVKSANGLDRPDVRAAIGGRGHRRSLAYRVDARPGQKVTFVERGPSGGTIIGTATAAAGRLRFRPGAGSAERRDIVAIVEQDGHVRDELSVARYRAPGPERPGRVRGLAARRHGASLHLRWRKARSATRHEVTLRLSDGRRLLLRSKRSRLVVPHVGRRIGGIVRVRGLSQDGGRGRAARRKV